MEVSIPCRGLYTGRRTLQACPVVIEGSSILSPHVKKSLMLVDMDALYFVLACH